MPFPIDISDSRSSVASISVTEPLDPHPVWNGEAGASVVTAGEAARSGGAYLKGDAKFAIPTDAALADMAPGWHIYEGSNYYTIIDATPHRLMGHTDVTARNLRLVNGLLSTIQVLRSKGGLMPDGRRNMNLENYIVVYYDQPARLQPVDSGIDTDMGVEGIRKRYTVFLELAMDVQIDDLIVDEKGNVYELKERANYDTIDMLSQWTVDSLGATIEL